MFPLCRKYKGQRTTSNRHQHAKTGKQNMFNSCPRQYLIVQSLFLMAYTKSKCTTCVVIPTPAW